KRPQLVVASLVDAPAEPLVVDAVDASRVGAGVADPDRARPRALDEQHRPEEAALRVRGDLVEDPYLIGTRREEVDQARSQEFAQVADVAWILGLQRQRIQP